MQATQARVVGGLRGVWPVMAGGLLWDAYAAGGPL